MWTQEEDDLLRLYYYQYTVKEIIKLNLIKNKNHNQIKYRVKCLKLKKGRGKFKRTELTKLKSSISAKKRVRSQEELARSKRVLLEYMQNHPHPCLGKTWKLSETKKRHFYGNTWHKGKKHTQATKDKISSTIKANMTTERRRKCKLAALKSLLIQAKHQTSQLETKIAEFLKTQNIKYIQQYPINNEMLCDFYLPACNLVIEADGEYWHSLEKAKIRDKRKNEYLSKHNINLLRISGVNINNGNFKQIILDKLEELI